MVLRKITIDNVVRFIPKNEKLERERERERERDNKPKSIKVGSLPPKRNKKLSQNI